jgi:hypothetical protein
MTDETREMDSEDARDEQVAQLLAVPALDDVTRRRLVRGALEVEVEEQRRAPRLAAVAAIAAALVIGGTIGALLVNRPDEPQTTTAQRAPSAAKEIAPSPDSSAGAAIGEAGPVTALADLGDVTDPETLRTSLQAAFERAAGPGDQSAVSAYPCAAVPPDSIGLVAVSALGTGTYQGAPVTILVGTSPAGRALAVVVRPPDCAVVADVPIPS